MAQSYSNIWYREIISLIWSNPVFLTDMVELIMQNCIT